MNHIPNQYFFFAPKLLLILLLGLILGLSACQSDSKSTSIEVMNFEVNAKLLNPIFEDKALQIRFQPPFGYGQVSKDSIKLIQAQLSQLNPTEHQALVSQAFINKKLTSFVTVSQYIGDNADSIVNATIADPQAVFNANNSWSGIRTATFLLNEFTAHQYLLQSSNWLSFKLILTDPNTLPIQLDYIMPIGNYPQQIKHIESSLGSIHFTQ